MKYSEAKRFTWGELQNLTWEDLENSPEVLKKEIEKFGSEIPYDVYVKICKLCDDINAIPDLKQNKKLEKPKSTTKDLLDICLKLFQLVILAPEVKKLCDNFFEWLFDFIRQNF